MHENAKEHLWKYNLIATILCAEKCCDLCPTFCFVKNRFGPRGHGGSESVAGDVEDVG